MGLISRPGFGCLLTNWLQEAVTCRNLGVTGSHTRKPTEREIPVEYCLNGTISMPDMRQPSFGSPLC